MKTVEKKLNILNALLLLFLASYGSSVFAETEGKKYGYRYIFSHIPDDKHKFLLIKYLDKEAFYFQLNKCEVEKTKKAAKDIILSDADLGKAKCRPAKEYKVDIIAHVIPLWFFNSGRAIITYNSMFLSMGITAVIYFKYFFGGYVTENYGREFDLGVGHFFSYYIGAIVGDFTEFYFADYLNDKFFKPLLFNHEFYELLYIDLDWINTRDDPYRYSSSRSIEGYLQMVERAYELYINDY